MKTYYKILKSISLLAIMSVAMASCDDWLTVHPQTQIVEENFWEDKTDLEGVRYAAYKSLADQVEKMIVWGDLRSDIYQLRSIRTSGQGNRDTYAKIRNAEIDTTLAIYDWSGMYSTIGYCNKVLQHGPEILEKDKQFTSSEWRQMEAEMVTMRALCYFYLVRAFKDVPYSTKVVNSDMDVEYFKQLPALDVMDSLINDVEKIAGHARNRFVITSETKGMITNTAIYALLSDMYLWRASLLQGKTAGEDTDDGNGDETEGGDNEGEGNEDGNSARLADGMSYRDKAINDYRKCIENSELSLGKLKEQFDEETRGMFLNQNDFISWGNAPEFAGKTIDFMYKNDIRYAGNQDIDLTAYENIFYYMNSYESIFELQFNVSDGRKNSFPKDLWGMNNNTTLVSTFNGSEQTNGMTDMRYWINGWAEIDGNTDMNNDAYVLKWSTLAKPVITGNGTTPTVKMTLVSTDYHNWIIWRLSDMLLNDAEARACLAGLEIDATENTDVCKKLLRMVNRRWLVRLGENDWEPEKDLGTAISGYDEYNFSSGNDGTKEEKLLGAVMNTRKLEFVGEGKRWFDLVRYAERISPSDDAQEGMYKMFDTFMADITSYETARNRCETLWGLYCPIYYMECKAYRAGGYNITQNPVWNKTKYDRK